MTQPEAPFELPWHAQVFAMTVALNESGHFTWAEWSDVFGPRIQDAHSEEYWEVWLGALVILLDTRGLAESALVEALKNEWQIAARQTPHGQPIKLKSPRC